MPEVGETFTFTGRFEVDYKVVQTIYDGAVIAKGKDGSLYAIHFFADEVEASQMKEKFASIKSFYVVKGYVLGEVGSSWALVAPVPEITSWFDWLDTTLLQSWRKMIYPYVVIPEETRDLIRKISGAILSIHNQGYCHGHIINSLMIGADDAVVLLPSIRNESIRRIQSDLDEYKDIINSLFKRTPGGHGFTKFEEEIFNELCSLSGAFIEKDGAKSKWYYAELLLTCPLDWIGRQRSNFMRMMSVEKSCARTQIINICPMDRFPAELLNWRTRLPGKRDRTPLYKVYNFINAPREYLKRTGFIDYRKNLDGHARDYKVGITADEVEDIFFFRWPDVVFKVYYYIVLAIASRSMPRARLRKVLHQ